MISEKENTKLSKFISLILRHQPEIIGLPLDLNGWADTNELIEKMNSNGFRITTEILNHIVSTNSKKRFSFNENKTLIRANQGHSIDVNLGLKQADPPAYLYHGTSEKSLNPILATGLDKRTRQHVHLSAEKETAILVGQRHGKPVVLVVASEQMKIDGYIFYLSDNNVWLTDNVPVKYLKQL